jgi:hypothetical protein
MRCSAGAGIRARKEETDAMIPPIEAQAIIDRRRNWERILGWLGGVMISLACWAVMAWAWFR